MILIDKIDRAEFERKNKKITFATAFGEIRRTGSFATTKLVVAYIKMVVVASAFSAFGGYDGQAASLQQS